MNIAFSAMVAIVILIPGLILRHVRRNSSGLSQHVPKPPQPFSAEIAFAVLYAVLVHSAALLIVIVAGLWFTKLPQPDLKAVLLLLMGQYGSKHEELTNTVRAITDFPVSIVSYFVLACAIAVPFGWLLSFVAPQRLCDWMGFKDSKDAAVFEWHNFFGLGKGQRALVTAVVDMGSKSHLFLGRLKNAHFNPDTAELDRIELDNVHKRLLGDDDSKFAEVFGHQFLLWVSEIKTLNVVFIAQEIEGVTTEHPVPHPNPPQTPL